MTAQLTPAQRRQLSDLEAIIQEGIESHKEHDLYIGKALILIRQNNLYRQTHPDDFKGYCKGRWGFSDSKAQRLMRFAEKLEKLQDRSGTRPNGGIPDVKESQLRPLTVANLPEEEEDEAWETAVESANGEAPTAEQVKDAVRAALEGMSPEKRAEIMNRAPKATATRNAPPVGAALAHKEGRRDKHIEGAVRLHRAIGGNLAGLLALVKKQWEAVEAKAAEKATA
jgi:hypothetical protein